MVALVGRDVEPGDGSRAWSPRYGGRFRYVGPVAGYLSGASSDDSATRGLHQSGALGRSIISRAAPIVSVTTITYDSLIDWHITRCQSATGMEEES